MNIYTYHCRDIHVLDCGGCPGPAGVSAKVYCMHRIVLLKGQLSPCICLVQWFRRKDLESHKMLSMPYMEWLPCLPFFFFQYNWHRTCSFQVYNLMIWYLYIPFFPCIIQRRWGSDSNSSSGLPVPFLVVSFSVLGKGLTDLMPKGAGWVSLSRSNWIFCFIVKGLGRRGEVKHQSSFLTKRRENSFIHYACNTCSSP